MANKTVKRSLSRVLFLKYELEGIVDREKKKLIVKGVLGLILSFSLRFRLNKIKDQVDKEYEAYEEAKKKMFETYGEEREDKSWVIHQFVKDEAGKDTEEETEKYKQYQEEHKKAIENEIELGIPETLCVEDFDGVPTEHDYKELFSIIEELQEQKPTV